MLHSNAENAPGVSEVEQKIDNIPMLELDISGQMLLSVSL